MKGWQSVLFLEQGHMFEGIGFGSEISQAGELVFNTGMTGYQEIITDPSYCNQIVVMTCPHIGNTGVNSEDLESGRIFLKGMVVREYCPTPSSWRSRNTLHQYLRDAGIAAISGVDSREITRIIRDEGAARAVIFPKKPADSDMVRYAKGLLEGVPSMEGLELVSKVSCSEPYEFVGETPERENDFWVAVYDFGVKLNILRHLKKRGLKVWVVPFDFPAEEVLLKRPLAVVLSNGPGDPAGVSLTEIEKLVGEVPIMAICMGHQLLGRVLGAKTYKLKFGHHGINHPVKDLLTGKILITSQNHGFALCEESLRENKAVVVSHISMNDGTVEGFISDEMKILSVQFHPEARPGPNDADCLFDSFMKGFLK